MPPFLSQIIGAIVRALVIWVAAKFGQELSDQQVVKIVAEVAPIVAVIAWSIWQKYGTRQKQLTAQASPRQVSEVQVAAMVKAGEAPSVLTPAADKPTLTIPTEKAS